MQSQAAAPAADLVTSRVVDHLVTATKEVFERMVFTTLTSAAPIEGSALRPVSNVVATVPFAGTLNGLVAFYATLGTAQAIAGAMLGLPPADIQDEDGIADAVGEIANMIAGSLARCLSSEGLSTAISIPTVTLGSDFYTRYVTRVHRVLCPFRMDGGEVFVELIVMQS